MKINSGLIVAMAAGSIAGLAQASDTVDPSLKGYDLAPEIRGYVYVNQTTGERVVSQASRQTVNVRGSGWAWDLTYPDPCDPDTNVDNQGYWYTPLHDAELGDEPAPNPQAVAAWHEWIESDGDNLITGFSWIYATAVLDPEEDGEVGHEMFLTFTENDNVTNRSGAMAHSPVAITELFGSADGSVAGWAFFVELDGDPIEIADTDGSAPDNPAGVDVDGDGLYDSGFMFTYNQPNVGEGDILGQRFPELAGVFPFDALDTGTFPNIVDVGPFLAHPSGNAGVGGEPNCYDPNGGDWPQVAGCDASEPSPLGTFDAFGLIDALGTDVGAFFFGGFMCVDNGPDLPMNQPWSGPAFAFNVDIVGGGGGGGCNAADIAEPFDVLDLADIAAFISGFQTQDPIADIAAPFGVFDLADIAAFVQAFQMGCP